MEERPSAVVLQEEAANRRELRRLRAGVVSVTEKTRLRLRQVRIVNRDPGQGQQARHRRHLDARRPDGSAGRRGPVPWTSSAYLPTAISCALLVTVSRTSASMRGCMSFPETHSQPGRVFEESRSPRQVRAVAAGR